MMHAPHPNQDDVSSPIVSPSYQEDDGYVAICNPVKQPEYMVLKDRLYWRGYVLQIKFLTTIDSAIDAIGGLQGYPVRGDIQGHFDLIQFINLVHALQVSVILFSHNRVVLIENNDITPMSYTEEHPSIEFHCVYYDGLFYHALDEL